MKSFKCELTDSVPQSQKPHFGTQWLCMTCSESSKPESILQSQNVLVGRVPLEWGSTEVFTKDTEPSPMHKSDVLGFGDHSLSSYTPLVIIEQSNHVHYIQMDLVLF